ncbi:MAG: hypothetical protein JXA20_10190 [Spirochaetes bacterium]|nr:hypothetical protein [Spirochaetota bacterium]
MNGEGKRADGSEIAERGDPSGLLESLERDCESRERDLAMHAGMERERLTREYDSEMLKLSKSLEMDRERAVGEERKKMEHRAAIERRKLAMNLREEFVDWIVRGAVGEFIAGNRRGYLEFLAATVAGIAAETGAPELIVRLSPAERGDEAELRRMIAGRAAAGASVEFRYEEGLSGGGLIVEDRATGLVYNHSLERIVYRNRASIRKAVLDAIAEAEAGNHE